MASLGGGGVAGGNAKQFAEKCKLSTEGHIKHLGSSGVRVRERNGVRVRDEIRMRNRKNAKDETKVIRQMTRPFDRLLKMASSTSVSHRATPTQKPPKKGGEVYSESGMIRATRAEG